MIVADEKQEHRREEQRTADGLSTEPAAEAIRR
jgi:hypothetical protein